MKQFKIKSTKNIGKPRRKGQYTATILLKVKLILHNSNSTLDYKMISRTFLATKISTSWPLKLWMPSFLKYQRETNFIKVADRSPAGWTTIAEYEDEPLASDSEDSKKIWQAENWALGKNKNKSSLTSSSKPDCTRRPQFLNDGFQHGFTISFFLPATQTRKSTIYPKPRKDSQTNRYLLRLRANKTPAQ